jgi:4a-hydroxytetrahydrobiopterin dehydratase
MNLLDQHCQHSSTALDQEAIAELLPQVAGWALVDGKLVRDYTFRDYHATIAFVNAIAAMANEQDHHPELLVTYRHCNVTYVTHSAGNAVSENDFICAARANALFDRQAGA